MRCLLQMMKPRLQTSLSQQLVMTPQLRQAIRLLQMSAAELEAEIAAAVESNPLLDWTDEAAPSEIVLPTEPHAGENGNGSGPEAAQAEPDEPWTLGEDGGGGPMANG